MLEIACTHQHRKDAVVANLRGEDASLTMHDVAAACRTTTNWCNPVNADGMGGQ
jgi:hypothetical protein